MGAREHVDRAGCRRQESGLCEFAGGMVSLESISRQGVPRGRTARLPAFPNRFPSTARDQFSAAGNYFTASGLSPRRGADQAPPQEYTTNTFQTL